MRAHTHTCNYDMHMEVRGQLAEHVLPFGFQGLDSGCQGFYKGLYELSHFTGPLIIFKRNFITIFKIGELAQ